MARVQRIWLRGHWSRGRRSGHRGPSTSSRSALCSGRRGGDGSHSHPPDGRGVRWPSLVTQSVTQTAEGPFPAIGKGPLSCVGLPGLEPGTSSLSALAASLVAEPSPREPGCTRGLRQVGVWRRCCHRCCRPCPSPGRCSSYALRACARSRHTGSTPRIGPGFAVGRWWLMAVRGHHRRMATRSEQHEVPDESRQPSGL
jgi:hypothetical protein